MAKRVWYEMGVIALLVIVFLFFFVQAITSGNKSIRDDIRLQNLTEIKNALEQYNNMHEYYPISPDLSIGCTSSNDQNSWFFGKLSPLISGQFITSHPNDPKSLSGYSYKYCVTAKNTKDKTSGYYIEAMYEIRHPDSIGFDEDEERKFGYRYLTQNNKTVYRVCGGEEKQCKEQQL